MLYRTSGTWAEFCKGKLGITQTWADPLIANANIAEELEQQVDGFVEDRKTMTAVDVLPGVRTINEPSKVSDDKLGKVYEAAPEPGEVTERTVVDRDI